MNNEQKQIELMSALLELIAEYGGAKEAIKAVKLTKAPRKRKPAKKLLLRYLGRMSRLGY